MLLKLKILLLLVLSEQNVFCQNIPQRLDSLFSTLYAYEQINGNVLVAVNGKPMYQKSFGYLNLKNKTLNTDKSNFSLASIAKTFTAIAILQLKENRKLKLDDFVVDYLPDFPYYEITIRNLLSHTSGLPEIEIFRQQVEDNPDKIFSNYDLLPTLTALDLPLAFRPNDQYEYTNSNYMVLALIIEKISGMTFQEYLKKNIFRIAKMNDTYFEKDYMHPANKNRVTNYTYPFFYSSELQNVDSLDQFRIRALNLSGFVGNGNIMTTSGDILKFDRALYTSKFVKPETFNEAIAPTVLNNNDVIVTTFCGKKASYGLGWFILDDTTSGKIVGHTGGVPGALSVLLRNIDKKETVILFDNAFNKSLYRSGMNAMNILDHKLLVPQKKSLTRSYGITLVKKGVDAAFCRLQELADDKLHYYISEEDMNELGLQLLYAANFEGHNFFSLEVLKLNTLLFPTGFNTYDSYGEALAKLGKKEEAIYMYRKSVKLNPANEAGKRMLEELSEN